MKFKLAIEDPNYSDCEDKSTSNSPSLPKVPLHAFLVYDECATSPSHDSQANLRRTVSVPGLPVDTTSDCSSSPPRRFSVCDLNTMKEANTTDHDFNVHASTRSNTIDTKRHISNDDDNKSEHFNSTTTNNHHRRPSVALRFETPRPIE